MNARRLNKICLHLLCQIISGQSRTDAQRELHHIIVRGVERKKIFEDDMGLPRRSNRLTFTSCQSLQLTVQYGGFEPYPLLYH